MNQDLEAWGDTEMWPEDLSIPENAPGFYLCYSVNGQRCWRWGKARALAIAIEALDLDPSVSILAFGIKGWDCVYQKVIHAFASSGDAADAMGFAAAGAFGASHSHSIGGGMHSHTIMTATEIAMKQQAAHQHAVANIAKAVGISNPMLKGSNKP